MKTMREYRVVLCASAAIWLFGPGAATAQDVAITNARIIVGNGVIESGTIVVRGGKIVSAARAPRTRKA